MVISAPGNVHIGTSGWNYPHWKGEFYPPGVPQSRWLDFFAGQFSTVEVNNTFYRKPTEAIIDSWQEQTAPGFQFATKMWRGITHYRQLLEAGALLEKFIPVISRLAPERRGPLLVQLPERMKPAPERLDDFLMDLTDSMDEPGFRVAVEFRNLGWIRRDVIDVLNAHNAALCLSDMAYCRTTHPNPGADFIYIRRHGGIGASPGNYTPAQIAHDARRIAAWLAQGRDVYVYYNNDLHAHAPDNARALERILAPLAPHAAG